MDTTELSLKLKLIGLRVFTHMVSCHHEEVLNYKFEHKRANKSLSDVDRIDQWFTAAEYLINQIAIKTDCGVATHKGPNVSTHYRIDIQSRNRAYIASIFGLWISPLI